MGCDIHSFAEKRSKETGKWELVHDAFTLDEYDRAREKKDKGNEPFDGRNYSVFGFLANVRNYSHCPPIAELKGLPDDSEYLNGLSEYADPYNRFTGKPIPESERETIKREIENDYDYHSKTYLTLRELTDFDYDKTFEDRRTTRKTVNQFGGIIIDGSVEAEEGAGEMITYREHLGKWFFIHLEDLKALGEPDDVRIVFWFDN